MKKRTLSVFCLILVVAMLCSPLKVFASDVVEDETDMIDIVIEMTEDRCIIASVPYEYAAEYQERINSDPLFRQDQINAFNEATNVNRQNTRSTFPEGPIEYQQEFDENDISGLINSIAGPSTYQTQKRLVNGIFTITDFLSLIQNCRFTTAMEFGANLLAITVSASAAQSEAWWKQAELDICNGVIRAVRYSIVQNVRSEYPKVWRVFERLT